MHRLRYSSRQLTMFCLQALAPYVCKAYDNSGHQKCNLRNPEYVALRPRHWTVTAITPEHLKKRPLSASKTTKKVREKLRIEGARFHAETVQLNFSSVRYNLSAEVTLCIS